MQIYRRTWETYSAMAIVLLCVSSVSAQERVRERFRASQEKQDAATAETAHRSTDQEIAQCLSISNQEEVALAKLAEAKAQNPQVKQFAEAMIKHHGDAVRQLAKFGAQPIALAAAGNERTRPATPEAAREAAGGTRRTAARESGLNFLDIKRQMAERCLAAAEKKWNEKQGLDADRCFVAQQVVAHEQALVAQEVLRPYASQELQQVIGQDIEVTQRHLAEAQELMEHLMAANSPRGADAPSK